MSVRNLNNLSTGNVSNRITNLPYPPFSVEGRPILRDGRPTLNGKESHLPSIQSFDAMTNGHPSDKDRSLSQPLSMYPRSIPTPPSKISIDLSSQSISPPQKDETSQEKPNQIYQILGDEIQTKGEILFKEIRDYDQVIQQKWLNLSSNLNREGCLTLSETLQDYRKIHSQKTQQLINILNQGSLAYQSIQGKSILEILFQKGISGNSDQKESETIVSTDSTVSTDINSKVDQKRKRINSDSQTENDSQNRPILLIHQVLNSIPDKTSSEPVPKKSKQTVVSTSPGLAPSQPEKDKFSSQTPDEETESDSESDTRKSEDSNSVSAKTNMIKVSKKSKEKSVEKSIKKKSPRYKWTAGDSMELLKFVQEHQPKSKYAIIQLVKKHNFYKDRRTPIGCYTQLGKILKGNQVTLKDLYQMEVISKHELKDSVNQKTIDLRKKYIGGDRWSSLEIQILLEIIRCERPKNTKHLTSLAIKHKIFKGKRTSGAIQHFIDNYLKKRSIEIKDLY